MNSEEPLVRWGGHRIYVRDHPAEGLPIMLLHEFEVRAGLEVDS